MNTAFRQAYRLGRADSVIPDPYMDLASLTMPTTLTEMLNVSEAEWLRNGTYRQAANRIVRYFITEIKFDGQSEEKAKDLKLFMDKSLRAIPTLMLVGDDFLGSGNSFSSTIIPFRRFLRCATPRCWTERPIEAVEGWEFKEFKWSAHCPKCRRRTQHMHKDRRSMEQDRFKIKRWSPKDMRIRQHTISQIDEYYYTIPERDIHGVRSGDRFTVETMPWEFIEAIKAGTTFKFDPRALKHMREETLASVNTHGWGIPRLMSNFAQAWYVRMLKRLNESLALDHVVPFKLLSPAVNWGAGGSDPSQQGVDANLFSQHMESMLLEHRMDPSSYHTSPIPVNYQNLGGDAKALTPWELIDKGQDELLNGMGIPAQMYRFDLQLQIMPTALRLFQQSWPQLVYAFNGWLDSVVSDVCTAMNWDKPDDVRLAPVTLADDLELRQVWLQLASANLISKGTAFAPWNVNAMAEQEKILREQAQQADLMEKFQEDMAARQQNKAYTRQAGGQPMAPPGGQPPPMGASFSGSVPPSAMTPGDRLAQADEIAQQLVQAPQATARAELTNIKNSDEPLWAMVKGRMQIIRQDAASQGRASLRGGM